MTAALHVAEKRNKLKPMYSASPSIFTGGNNLDGLINRLLSTPADNLE
jgi:hypothetical protein